MHVVVLWDEVTGDKPTHGNTTRKKPPAPAGPSCYEATNANHHATHIRASQSKQVHKTMDRFH